MPGAASVLEVLIIGDATSLKASLAQATVATEQFAATSTAAGKTTAATTVSASKLGSVAKIGYTAAAAGAFLFAKASFESANEFEKAFVQIQALTNTADASIAGLKETVLNLAGETAQSPVELAHAMYFLASAGLSTQQQMEAIDATAKGMAIGLGEAGDLARITANALNVFGDDGLTAAGVMDTLAAAIREGTAEPDEFADALGRVLPIADKAGISFQQVAASLATMSNAGLDVHEGVTALRAILQSLVSPTAQTVTALDRIGLTVDDVVKSMKGQGLISTLRMLDEQARKNTGSQGEYNMLMRKLIPNIRGLAGAFNLTTQEAAKVDQIFKAVAESTGTLEEAFLTTSEAAPFKVAKAFNDIAIAGQKMASDVLPMIAEALSAISGPLTSILPLAAKLGAVWLGYKFLSGIASIMDTLAAAHAAVAVSAQAEAVAQTDVAAALTVSTAAAQKAIVANEELAAAQATASKTAAGKGIFGTALAGASGFLATLGGVAVVGHHMFDSIMKGADDTANEFNITEQQAASLEQRLSHGALVGGEGGILHWLADPLATTGAKTEEAALRFEALSAELLTAGVGMDDINKSFEANTGVLNANRSSIDPWIESIRQGALENAGLDQATLDAAESLKKQEEAAQSAREKTDQYKESVADLTAPLQQLSTLGFDVTGFLSDFRGQLEESKNPMATFQEGIDSVMASMSEWRSKAADSLTGIGDLLGTLSEKSGVSLSQITTAFQKQAEMARNFADDLAVIGNTGGQAGKQLAAGLLEGGLGMAGLANTIATGSESARRDAVHAFGGIIAAGQSGASQLQRVLVPVLKDIRDILFKLAHDKWGIDLTENDHGSQKKLDKTHQTLQDIDKGWTPDLFLHVHDQYKVDEVASQLERLDGKQFNAFLNVHTRPKSPWPDEALKQHLTDPLKGMGAKKIGGVWTIPLEVGVHTATSSLAIQKAVAAAPRGFAMAKDAVGADRYAKLMKAIKDDAHKTGELHLKALRKIIADEASPKRAREWAAAAVEAFNQRMQQAEEPPAWIALSGHNVPRLPRGVGDRTFEQRHHHRREINIKLDRKHYSEAMTQEVSYGRGY